MTINIMLTFAAMKSCFIIVVQLFNAVNKQQKDLQSQLEAVGSSETKRSKGSSCSKLLKLAIFN